MSKKVKVHYVRVTINEIAARLDIPYHNLRNVITHGWKEVIDDKLLEEVATLYEEAADKIRKLKSWQGADEPIDYGLHEPDPSSAESQSQNPARDKS